MAIGASRTFGSELHDTLESAVAKMVQGRNNDVQTSDGLRALDELCVSVRMAFLSTAAHPQLDAVKISGETVAPLLRDTGK